jgi:hypothetical protein
VRGEEAVLEVEDPYGTFTEAAVLESLARGAGAGTADLRFREQSAGAGMGVYMVYQGSTRMFVGIERGRRTSIVCLVDLKARRKAMAEWVRSLHVIEVETSRETILREGRRLPETAGPVDPGTARREAPPGPEGPVPPPAGPAPDAPPPPVGERPDAGGGSSLTAEAKS